MSPSSLALPSLTNYRRGELIGSVVPRLWTPPLRPLVPDTLDDEGNIIVPATSIGFDQNRFARNVLRHPADPWQEWLFVHAGELLPDGRPRFRIVLVLVSRQNGKTECPVILTCYWMFVDKFPLTLGTSTKLEYAKETWDKTRKLIKKTPAFADKLNPKGWYVRGNNNIEMWNNYDSRYKIAAANEEGGRSLTINRLICDELRQHHDYSAWGAAEEATSAVWDSQIWALSNAGDDRSVVLNDLRKAALEFITWTDEVGAEHVGELLPRAPGDYRLGLFEWSAEDDADPEDITALRQANPNLGLRKDPEALLLKARRAVRVGGEALATLKTESMCMNVKVTNPAINPTKWEGCDDPGDLSQVRSRVACCLDVAPDGAHVSLLAAAVLPDDRVRVEVVAAWDSPDAARAALPDLLARVKPQKFGWLPDGPAAALAADLKDRRKQGRRGWPPVGVTVEEIRAELPAVCMGLAEQVSAGRIAHSDDPLINAQVDSAEKLSRGKGVWIFARGGAEHVDAVYAMAGAVHLARTLPPPPGKPRLVVVADT